MQILRNFDELFHFGGKKSVAVRPASPKILVPVYVKTAGIELLFQCDDIPDKR